MKIYAIKTDKGAVISDLGTHKTYGDSSLIKGFLFDGKKPENTFHDLWFAVDAIPTKCQKIIPEKTFIAGYDLKEGFPVTDKTPKRVEADFFEYDHEEERTKNYELKGLYVADNQTIPVSYEDEELEIELLAVIDDFDSLRGFKYQVKTTSLMNGKNYVITEQNLKHQLADKIFFPEPLLATRPCKLGSEDSYAIIRAYIKDNINPKMAEITSDYDFCFTVKKRISLAEPVKYTVDANFNPFSKRKKKAKYVTRFQTERQVAVYECAPFRPREGVYNGYTQCPSFEGKSYDDLQNNIAEYLQEVITEINRPLKDCPHCKGMGVIVEETSEEVKS
jgi:hypothetical protein